MIVLKRRPYKLNFSGNPIVYTLQVNPGDISDDVIFEVRLMFQRIGEPWDIVTTLFLTPVEGIASIDVSELLDTRLEFEVPVLDGNPIQPVKKQTGFFYIEYREYNSFTNTTGPFVITENQHVRHVTKGGIRQDQLKGNNYWDLYYPGKKPWMTWQPNGRMAALDERMYLAFLCRSNAAFDKIVVYINVMYTDKTQAWKALYCTAPVENFMVYVRCGAMENNLHTLTPGKTIWYWELSAQDITNPLAPVSLLSSFRFTADNRQDYNRTTLYYRNSLGGLDSFRVRGAIKTSVTLEGSEVTVAVPADWMYSDSIPRIDSSTPHRELVTYKGEIGHMDKAEKEALRDAYLYREAWKIKLGRWLPIKPVSKNYDLGISTDKRFSLPFEWMEADDGSYHYTPDIDFGDVEPINNVCDARIENITTVKENGPDNTSIVTWSWDVISEDEVEFVEYKIEGYTDWIRLPNPTVPKLKTVHTRTFNIIFKIRPVCHAGSYGPETALGLVGFEIEEPVEADSMIYNNTSFYSPFKVEYIDDNGIELLDQGVLQAAFSNPFYSRGKTGPCKIVLTVDDFVPNEGRLLTNGSNTVYLGSIVGNKITWQVNIIDSFYLIIS